MKKLSKILSIVILALMLLTITSNIVLATSVALDPKDITGDMNDTSAIQTVGQKIVGIIQVAGSVIAVVILAVLGIKYMMGSTEEKAEYKKTLMPYLVGAVLIFAASNLASVIVNFAAGITL